MQLYRPVGLHELRLIYQSGMRAFPPRLPEQPIFYPVLNFAYAAQIAREWNTKSDTFAGYVTEFAVDDGYVAQFERQIVGSRMHEELWVPAEQLAEFNRHIVGLITVSAAYFGPQFQGYAPTHFGMKDMSPVEQFSLLAHLLDYNGVDFLMESYANRMAIFLHFPFWKEHDFSERDISAAQKERVLAALASTWQERFPEVRLPGATQTL
ncbi:MAG: hypothetical protein MUD01_12435 [Chloroflexaceae bacterium]|jgi:hypothetical protein|nr:hypothetical protein [Chloroflexaceae bacterium]